MAESNLTGRVGSTEVDANNAAGQVGFRHIYRLNSQSFGHVADQVAQIAATVKQGHHGFLRGLARGFVARVPDAPLGAQVFINGGEQGFEFLLGALQIGLKGGIFFAHLAGHAHFFKLHVELEDFFEQIGGNAGDICLPFAGSIGVFAGVLFAYLGAFKLEQVFGAMQRIFESAIGVIDQRRVCQAPFTFLFGGTGEAVGVQLAAEAVKLVFEGGRST